MTANQLRFAELAAGNDDDISIHCSFQSLLASSKLNFRYGPVVVLVEFYKLLRVPDR
jgi:hypothetical protein